MKDIVLARRYARALLDIAVERDILGKIHQEVTFFRETLEKNHDLRLFLYSQEVSSKEKKAAMERLLQDRVSNVFFNFILVLLRKNRQRLFPIIAQEFSALVDRRNKRLRAVSTTALPLDASTAAQLKSVLDKMFDADVTIENRVEPSILGGLIVNVEGRVLDGSLRSQLSRLKQRLTERVNSMKN